MPTIASSLGTDLMGISWALLSYQLSNIGLSIIFGRLADLWGRERIFGLGFLVISASSLLCGMSQNLAQLVVFRFVQGIGGAMLQSSSRALAAEAVPEELAGRAQGYMTTGHHLGFLLGPGIAGLMIDMLSWRWVFFFLIPLGIAGAFLTWISAGRATASRQRRHAAIDYAGAALLIATTSTVILLLDRRTMQAAGGEARIALALLFAGLLCALIFHESRAKSPFVDLTLFRLRTFSLSVASLLVIAICYTLTGFLLPFYLQEILGLAPTTVGLLFMAPSALTVALAPVSGMMTDRFGPRFPSTLGVTIMFVALLTGTLLRTDSGWPLPVLLIVLMAVTNGIFNPANSMAMIGLMPKEHRGFASAINHVTFGFGNLTGVALGSFLMAAAFEYHTGVAGAVPTTSEPSGFVAALNTTFFAASAVCIVALFTSAFRGGGKPARGGEG